MEEVVQLYETSKNSHIKASLKSIKGFSRISFKADESKKVKFKLTPADLSHIQATGDALQFN